MPGRPYTPTAADWQAAQQRAKDAPKGYRIKRHVKVAEIAHELLALDAGFKWPRKASKARATR